MMIRLLFWRLREGCRTKVEGKGLWVGACQEDAGGARYLTWTHGVGN